MKKINLSIDVGNTNIVFGFFIDNKLLYSFRMESEVDADYNDYFAELHDFTQKRSINISRIEKIALSSVIPSITDEIVLLIKKKFKRSKFVTITPFSDLGLQFPMKNPGYIGSDLIVNAFAAKEIYKENCIICDFGTASTFQLVGGNGYFYGTIIAPGINTAAESLYKNAALLEEVELENPTDILGQSTKEAILSGIVTGNALMTDGFIRSIKNKYKEIGNIITIATGGNADLIKNNTQEIDILDIDLTLKGLNTICNKI